MGMKSGEIQVIEHKGGSRLFSLGDPVESSIHDHQILAMSYSKRGTVLAAALPEKIYTWKTHSKLFHIQNVSKQCFIVLILY